MRSGLLNPLDQSQVEAKISHLGANPPGLSSLLQEILTFSKIEKSIGMEPALFKGIINGSGTD